MENWNIPPCFYRLSVKALIHDEQGRFLLVKEENNLWELPGG
jgi:8-oxo-dGTP diphosphatase